MTKETSWLNCYQTLLQGAEVLVQLPQQQPEFAARHVELLLGLVALPGLVLRLELRPQSLQGGLLRLPGPQILLQILQSTNIRDRDAVSWQESEYSTIYGCICLL